MIAYRDFSIQIEAPAAGQYTVQVIDSPAGQSTTVPFQVPAITTAGGETGSVFRAFGNFGGTSVPSTPRELGTRLFEALFTGPVGTAFSESKGLVHGKGGLRVKLHLDLNQKALAPLANIPWEMLYDPQKNEYLNLNIQTPVVRFFEVLRAEDPGPFTPPLRVLVVLANPPGTHPLDIEKERRKIEGSWQDKQHVSVEVVRGTTLKALRATLKENTFHVLHYSGHGTFDEQSGQGVLLMEDENGGRLPVHSEQLRVMLRGTGVRFVFLNACQTAQRSQREHLDPFAGLASALVMEGVPAVVAMQFPISDDAAITFPGVLYEQLALSIAVDEAVSEGRVAISFHDDVAWATPVLFMRASDGALFSNPTLQQDSSPINDPMSTFPKGLNNGPIRQLVAQDKLEEALDQLEAWFKDRDEDLYNEATSHKAALKRAKKQGRRGIISGDEENQERTRIRFAILEELLPESEVD